MVAPSLDFLNSFMWQFATIAVAIVAVIVFVLYRYWWEPPISRQFTSAHHRAGPVGFIQDDANQVHLVTSQAALPEGVIFTKRGFFLQSRAPYIAEEPLGQKKEKRGVGRPKKVEVLPPPEPVDKDLEREVFSTVLQAPILAGFGKAVFFGYDGAPLVSNLKTLALTTGNALTVHETFKNLEGTKIFRSIERFVGHADLRIMKEIIPATISRTQLGNLYRWALNKGYEKRGGDQMKLIMIVLCVMAPIAVTGIIAYLLMNGPK